MLSINCFYRNRCFLFKISTTLLIFVVLIRHINTKFFKSCSESQKVVSRLLKLEKVAPNTPKVAQKLPSTICLGQPASRLYLKEVLNILQTVSSCSSHTTFFRFGSRFHRQILPVLKRFRSDLRTNLSVNADFSENTFPFVS